MKLSGIVFLALAATLSPFAIAANAPPDSGLLITRVNSEQWQVRLVSGGQAQQFSFVIDSDLPYSAMSGVNVKNTDSAKLLSSSSLSATLSTAAGGVNGVNFSVSPDAKLCVRDTGNSGVHIYLGDKLSEAMPVSAPVALTSADACGDATAAVDSAMTSSLATSGRKYHPGHWIVMG